MKNKKRKQSHDYSRIKHSEGLWQIWALKNFVTDKKVNLRLKLKLFTPPESLLRFLSIFRRNVDAHHSQVREEGSYM